MDEATQTPRSSDRNLIIYLGVLMIGYWLLRSILERFTGLSEGTNIWIATFVLYAAFYPVQTKIRLGKEELKKKTLRLWLVDAFLWASALFTLYTALGYVSTQSK